MRRALYLFAVMVVGAVSTASAQARARVAARLDVQATPPNLLVHVSDLLEDPVWLDALHNAYKIRVHWRVQLWRSRTLFDEPQLPVEWDDIIQQVPVLDVYTYTEPGGSTPMTTRFDTLDKLKDWVTAGRAVEHPGDVAGRTVVLRGGRHHLDRGAGRDERLGVGDAATAGPRWRTKAGPFAGEDGVLHDSTMSRQRDLIAASA